MAKTPANLIARRVAAMNAAPYTAIVPGFFVVCEGCNGQVPGFWHHTQDGKWLGYCCTPLAEKEKVAEKWIQAGGAV